METVPADTRVVSPALVGRTHDLELLVDAVCAPPAITVVAGEAGVGKTRLVTELLAETRRRGRVALLGRCPRIRESFPLAPLLSVVRGLGDATAELPLSPVAGALAPLLPEIAASLPAPPPPLDDRAAERHRVFRGLADVLQALGPAVVVLDDLHWADEQTVDFLTFLLADPPPELALVLSFRGEEVHPSVRALTASVPRTTGKVEVSLRPLDERQVGALAAAILGAPDVSGEFAGYLRERTGGLPFAIEEVLALLQTRGTLVRAGGQWERKTLDELEVPSAIRDSTLERLSRLSPSARVLAEAAAVLQDPVAAPTLVATCELSTSDASRALDEALRSALLHEDGDAVGFRHVLAAQAVYEDIAGPRRRELHARAAAALQQLPTVPLGQAAHHLRHAGRPPAWAATAVAAADQAVELAHETEAVRLLQDVLDHAPLDPAERGRIGIKLGWAAVETLHARDVVDTLHGLVDDGLAPAVRGELRFLIAIALGQAGEDLARQRQLFLDALPDLENRAGLRAWAMVALGLTSPRDVPLSEDVAWLTRSLSLVDEIDDRLLQVFVLGKAGSTLLSCGSAQWRGVADRVLELTDGQPRQRREANAYCSIGIAACYSGYLRTAEDLLTRGLHAAATQESLRLEIMLRCADAVRRYLDGTWDRLDHDVTGLLAQVGDYATSRMDLELAAGGLALAHGDLRTARELLPRVAAFADEIGAWDVVPVAHGLAIRAALARSDVDDAVGFVRQLVEALAVKGLWAGIGWALPSAVEALATAGRSAEAKRLLDDARQWLRGLDAPLAAPALRHARGLLTGSAADLLAAAERYDELPVPYEAARAREQAAGQLLAAGDQPAGHAALRAAFDRYRGLGATWDQTRAARLARQHGLTLPTSHPRPQRRDDPLTRREREVADLAATGRTNGEIASELFVAVSTVEKHMNAVMRKLHVRSRTELAHELRRTAMEK